MVKLKIQNISDKYSKVVTRRLTLEKGHTLKDVMNPAYWALAAKKVYIGDTIEVLAHDKEFFAEFLIVGLPEDGVELVKLREVDLIAKRFKGKNDVYEMKELGNAWCITRKQDNSIVEKDMTAIKAHEIMNRFCGKTVEAPNDEVVEDELTKTKLDSLTPEQKSEYTVKFSPKYKHSVYKGDARIKEGFKTEKEALEHINNL